MTQKSLIKMQISPIKNPNFEKPPRNLSNRTKGKILKKNFFGYLSKKFWFRVCSAWIVHVNMFTFYHWLSMRGNSFLVCSACDEIGSA